MVGSLKSVLFLQHEDALRRQEDMARARLSAAFPGVRVACASAPQMVPEAEFEAIITPTLPWLPEALARVRGCGWVHFLSAGVERIWEMPVDWSGLELTRSSGIHGPQMSEYAIGALLHFAKGFDRYIAQSRTRTWQRAWQEELSGQTLMVLGGGAVGAMVGQRARVFDMRVLSVTRRAQRQDWADLTLDLASARAHLAEVSALVVCLPLTEATRGLVDEGFLSALAPGAVLVDVSRGGVVVADAVLAQLDRGHLRGAALDVFEQEPLPAEAAVWDRPDVLVTPHVSGTSPHYMQRALQLFIDLAGARAQGRPLATLVDQTARY